MFQSCLNQSEIHQAGVISFGRKTGGVVRAGNQELSLQILPDASYCAEELIQTMMRADVVNRNPKLTWGLSALLAFVVVLFVFKLLPEESSIDYKPLISSNGQESGKGAWYGLLEDGSKDLPEGIKSKGGGNPSQQAAGGRSEKEVQESGDVYSRYQEKREALRHSDLIYPSTLPEQEYVQYARLVEGLRDLNDFLAASENGPGTDEATVVAHSLRYTRSLELAADKLASQSILRAQSAITRLRNELRNAIHKNQNPSNCSDVEAIGCKIGGTKGFAAAFGEMTHCLASGLMLKKTVVFNFSRWVYAGNALWVTLFEPITGCEIDQFRKGVDWTYPKDWWLERKYMTRLPDGIAKDLVAFHGDPLGWFHGQLASYILRPTKSFQNELDAHVLAVDENRDYVGLHIRRTDKGSEALLRDTKHYMRYAAEYFRRESLKRSMKAWKVYIATDEPEVVEELKRNYPKINFFSNIEAIQQANDVPFRTSKGALRNVMIDFYVLSRSQYFACALSSGFARVTYSLMQYEYSDAWRRIRSLDVPFYYAYAFMPERIPVEPVDDLVLPDEAGFSNFTHLDQLDKTTAYSLAKEYYFGWAKTKLLPDGTVPTYVGSKVQAKFKTEQPFRTGTYLACRDSVSTDRMKVNGTTVRTKN